MNETCVCVPGRRGKRGMRGGRIWMRDQGFLPSYLGDETGGYIYMNRVRKGGRKGGLSYRSCGGKRG